MITSKEVLRMKQTRGAGMGFAKQFGLKNGRRYWNKHLENYYGNWFSYGYAENAIPWEVFSSKLVHIRIFADILLSNFDRNEPQNNAHRAGGNPKIR